MRSLQYYIRSPETLLMVYHIVNVFPEYDYDDNDKQYEIIETFKSYESADAKFDEWSEKLPHAYLEIVSV